MLSTLLSLQLLNIKILYYLINQRQSYVIILSTIIEQVQEQAVYH